MAASLATGCYRPVTMPLKKQRPLRGSQSCADSLGHVHLLLVGLGLVGGLALGRGGHAGGGDTVEEALDLGRAVRELEAPEVVARVLDELDEGDEQAPGVRPVHD